MEDLQLNVEAVIQKWSSHHTAGKKIPDEEKTWYKKDHHSTLGESATPIHRKRSRKLLKSKARNERTLAFEEALQTQRRFKIIPPVLQNPFQEYHTHFCKKCQNVLEFVKLNNNTRTESQPLHLMEHIATKTSIKNETNNKNLHTKDVPPAGLCRFLACKILGYLQSSFTSLCFQSKDEVMVETLRENDFPVIFTHDCKDVFTTFILHLFFICIDSKIPLTVIKDSSVTSFITRYVLKKIGVLFFDELDEKRAKEVATELLSHLETNQSILIPSRDYHIINTSAIYNVIDQLLQAQRDNDKRLSRAVIVPVSLSMEAEVNQARTFSLVDLLTSTLSSKVYGLAQLNLAQPVKFKSIVKLAAELNHQKLGEEEDNIISRHLNFDFQETSVILPINVVAFLFLTKYRVASYVNVPDLISQTEQIISQLKRLNKYVGFTGETDAIVWHALNLMKVQSLVQLENESEEKVTILFNNRETAFKISHHASKVLQLWIPRSILASAIIACCGGEQAMHQGSGDDLNVIGSQLIEKAEFLSEMISFLVDFHCSFNVMTDSMTSALDQFVTMDILRTNEGSYEDITHQRLANNLNMEFEDDDDVGGQNDENSYQVIYSEETIGELQYYAGCVTPFVDLCYILLAIIREEFDEKRFCVNDLFKMLHERNEKQLFKHGEMVSLQYIARFCDYLFENEYIDDEKDMYLMSETFRNNGELLHLLNRISEFR